MKGPAGAQRAWQPRLALIIPHFRPVFAAHGQKRAGLPVAEGRMLKLHSFFDRQAVGRSSCNAGLLLLFNVGLRREEPPVLRCAEGDF